MNMQTSSEETDASVEAAIRIVDDAWEEYRRSPFVQQQLGTVMVQLPDISFTEAQRRSAVGKELLQRLQAVNPNFLPRDLALTLRLVHFRARSWAREADWYWIVTDPMGTGSYGMFVPTAYCGGLLLNVVHGHLASFAFGEAADAERYLEVVRQYAGLIDQFAARTAGQAERGVRMPKPQVQRARAMLASFKSRARAVLGVAPQRLTAISVPSLAADIERCIDDHVNLAFDRALACLSDDYLALAPDTVGIGQYPRGAEIYSELVQLHTTLDLTPDQIHERGHNRITEIETSMDDILAELGFRGDKSAFLAHLNQDSRWRANTVEGVTAVFQRYIDRLKPCFDRYFPAAPEATCGVAPLPEALQASMTYGYFDSPRPGRRHGVYLFNTSNLTKQPLVHIGALTYHELMPGHHLHIALQQENKAFHPFRRYSFVNAFNEGWAEYVATFVGEIGLYHHPEERYGRVTMDAFLTSRLVVDTGMNALGWSLERARDYMRQHSGMTEAEILSETLRYSCDMPGQALAYKLGDTYIRDLRERMRSAQGARFEIKDFHSLIMSVGTLPLPDLQGYVESQRP